MMRAFFLLSLFYGLMMVFLFRFRSLAFPLPWPPGVWEFCHVLLTILTAFMSWVAAVNIFLWRERVVSYALYLAPVLLLGGLLDVLHMVSIPLMPEQLVFFDLGPEANLWFWLAGRIVFACGLVASAVVLVFSPRVKRVRAGIQFVLLLVMAGVIIAFPIGSEFFPPLQVDAKPTFFKGLGALLPVGMMLLALAILKERLVPLPGEDNGGDYVLGSMAEERRSFVCGLHFLVTSQLFFLPSLSTYDVYSLIGHLLKLISFVMMAYSLWLASVQRSYTALKKLLGGGIMALVEAIEAFEPETSGHSRRVARYARLLGEAMDLSPPLQEQLWLAALVHDVGKIFVAPQILTKPGVLSQLEWSQIKQHPLAGARIVRPLGLPWCEEAVAQHHERPDGGGYPQGIKGAENINLLARIIAVADAFDAMTSRRLYRTPLLPEEAKQVIIREAGRQFDAGVVKAMEEAWDQMKAIWQEELGVPKEKTIPGSNGVRG